MYPKIFSQALDNLNYDNSIYDEIDKEFPRLTPNEIRTLLGAFEFSGEDVFKKIKDLSGGEKVRVMLSKLMISGANVLIIDEPTDHLDMESITALNNGLIKFPGVTLFTSHDHQFIQTTANRIMEIMPNGQLIDKMTTYDEYLASDEMAKKRQGVVDNVAEEDED